VVGLEPGTTYRVRSKPQRLMIDRFGDLINHVTPVRLDPRGMVLSTAAKFTSLADAAEVYVGTGALLAQGIRLHHQFSGTEYHPGIRMLGVHGQTRYVVERLGEGRGPEPGSGATGTAPAPARWAAMRPTR